jgi:hypothetical protein
MAGMPTCNGPDRWQHGTGRILAAPTVCGNSGGVAVQNPGDRL